MVDEVDNGLQVSTQLLPAMYELFLLLREGNELVKGLLVHVAVLLQVLCARLQLLEQLRGMRRIVGKVLKRWECVEVLEFGWQTWEQLEMLKEVGEGLEGWSRLERSVGKVEIVLKCWRGARKLLQATFFPSHLLTDPLHHQHKENLLAGEVLVLLKGVTRQGAQLSNLLCALLFLCGGMGVVWWKGNGVVGRDLFEKGA